MCFGGALPSTYRKLARGVLGIGVLAMSQSRPLLRKYLSPQMIGSSFAGMVMALPLMFAFSSSASRVNTYQAQPAVQNQSTAQVSQADFAKFVYAYE